jgi:AcrR family transcriptional regulator
MNKKELIINAALNLFVENGFHGTATSKIAKEAGVANGTLFHHYKTKDELILALYLDINTRLTEYIQTNASKDKSFELTFKSLFTNTLEWAQEHPQEFYFIQQFHNSPFLSLVSREELMRQTKPHLEMIDDGIKNKVLKPLPSEFLLSLINSHIYGINQYMSKADLSSQKQKQLIHDASEIMWDMMT